MICDLKSVKKINSRVHIFNHRNNIRSLPIFFLRESPATSDYISRSSRTSYYKGSESTLKFPRKHHAAHIFTINECSSHHYATWLFARHLPMTQVGLYTHCTSGLNLTFNYFATSTIWTSQYLCFLVFFSRLIVR